MSFAVQSSVVYFMKQHKEFYDCDNFLCSYVEKYNLEEPCDDIQHVLKCIAVKLGKTKRVKAITGVGKLIHSGHSIFFSEFTELTFLKILKHSVVHET